MIWPATVMKNAGYDIEIIEPHQRKTHLGAQLDMSGRVVDVITPPDADVIVIQRITHDKMVSAIPLIRKRGIAVVMDIDDDLSAIHPDNAAFAVMHPADERFPDHNWHNAQRACEASTAVIVSTPGLLPVYGAKGNGHVLYNCVPERYLTVKHYDSDVIGWGGSMHSHPDDPAVMGNAIQRLMRDGHQFRVIGDGIGVQRALHLDVEPEVTGVVDLVTSWPEMLSSLGVGVAPLSNTRFNRSKSWLKMLEMAAVGVPCVVSPRAEYLRLHYEGIGNIADKPQQWYTRLKRLATDADYRLQVSQQGREIAAQHTIEGNAWRWMEVWENAFKLERSNRPVFGFSK